jgi:hypothetical protein
LYKIPEFSSEAIACQPASSTALQKFEFSVGDSLHDLAKTQCQELLISSVLNSCGWIVETFKIQIFFAEMVTDKLRLFPVIITIRREYFLNVSSFRCSTLPLNNRFEDECSYQCNFIKKP